LLFQKISKTQKCFLLAPMEVKILVNRLVFWDETVHKIAAYSGNDVY